MRARTGGIGRLATAAAAWVLLLAGCSSGGGDGATQPEQPATYRIVATVGGLAGAGLVLHSSLGDDLAVTASGQVAFPTRAQTGTAYAVTVTRQPTTPWQTCAVTGGVGTIGTADAAVTVTCTTDRFEIGGTVTGLETSGLVLSLNGTFDASIVTTGAFAFSTELESGASFAVTVKTQPAGQTCAVTGGSGTVAGSDVTTVAVACTTTGYTIGGIVRGLLGSGLVLANGGELLPVAASGGFAFTTAVPYGRTYAVTVSTQPAGPAQTCTVENGAGTVSAAVTDVVVQCSSTFQSWAAPAALGALWPDSATMVHHAHFEAGGVFTDKGPALAMVGGAEPAPYALAGLPGGATRYAGGPFPDEAVNYQATGASALDLPGNMLACAVIKPARNRPFSGWESPILAKGVADGWSSLPAGGWVLRQMHESWCFEYQYTDRNGATHPFMASIENFYPDQDFVSSLVPPQPLPDALREPNPSFMVVCGGRDGDRIVIAANSWTDGSYDWFTLGEDQQGVDPHYPGPYALDAATARALTVGGFDATTSALHAVYPSAFVEGQHTFDGFVYETAVWNEPASAANVQAKMAPFLGLAAGTTYARNREGAWTDGSGRLHVAGRNAPRVDPVRGYLFGLQSWNRVSYWIEPNSTYTDPMVFPAGENLDLWARTPSTGAGAPTITLDPTLTPPGDVPLKQAQLVTLPPGAALSIELDQAPTPSPTVTDPVLRARPTWDATGPIQGQLWVRPVTSSGTVTVQKTDPAPGSGAACTVLGTPGVTCEARSVDLALLTAAQWNRVSLDQAFTADATTDGSGRTLHRGTLVLANDGPDPVSFYAWGVQLTQLGGGGDLGAFDPAASMYDWSASRTHYRSELATDPWYTVDALVVGTVAESTAATGFCLGAEASMPPGLGWSAPFARARTALAWNGAGVTARLYVAGQDGTADAGRLCFAVAGTTSATLCAPVPAGWAADGAKHVVKACMSPAGQLRLSGDDVELGTAASGLATPDLAGGTLLLGNERADPVAALPAGGLTPWHGYVSRLLVCRDTGDGADCR